MKVAISVESTADFTKEMIEKFDFKIIPFGIQLGEKSYFDGEITTDEIISFVDRESSLIKSIGELEKTGV